LDDDVPKELFPGAHDEANGQATDLADEDATPVVDAAAASQMFDALLDSALNIAELGASDADERGRRSLLLSL
jgi:hypothetical protein